ncbi:MAG: DUF5916 domain-containing protein [bacterium]
MKSKLFFFNVLLIFPLTICPAGSETDTTYAIPSIKILKIEQPLELTGKLDNPVWLKAESVELNFEINPGDNIPAPQKTIVKCLYDEEKIYFGFQCYDTEPYLIRANISERDKIFSDDYVIVCIDTYGDFQRSYELAVNPFGIMGDLLATLNNEDASVDLIWYSAASVHENGWTAEMAIPFTSLNFPDNEKQNWRLNLIRTIPRASRTQVSWTRIDKNIPGIMTQAGFLNGLENIEPGSSIELLPYAIGQQNGQLNNFGDPNSGFKYNNFESRFGGGIKYAPSANFSIDAVINPDFSQIESDADQISVNTTFALYYEEKRPFFLLGNDLLQTPMYYSRSINDPLAAGRIIGKSGSLSYLYMSAYDRNTVFVIPGEERSNTVATELNSLANVGRLRYDFGDESYIGGLVLGRNLSDAHNYVVGFDWNYKFWENWYFNGEGFFSTTKELNDSTLFEEQRKFGNSKHTAGFDGENYSGAGLHLVLSRYAKSYSFDFVYNDFAPTYQTYNGLFDETSYRQLYTSHQYVFYFENTFIDRARFGFDSNLQFNYEGTKKEQTFIPFMALSLKGQTSVYASYLLLNDERFYGKLFEGIHRVQLEISTRPLNEISIYLFGQTGNFIYRSDSPEMGNGHTLETNLTLKPTSRLNISLSYVRASLSSVASDELFYEGNIYRAVGIYQFTPEMFFRTIVQYNSFSQAFQIYPLLSYKLNAFTTFYVGATGDYYDYKGEHGIVNTKQQFFLKIQYLFGI